jgi:hypothetical protein
MLEKWLAMMILSVRLAKTRAEMAKYLKEL